MFIKYPHLERLGNDGVDGILNGLCYVFPKIDGTNASVWYDGELKAGSRRRELTLEQDNAGFYAYVLNSGITEKLERFFAKYPDYTLYGEWLVKHTLKTYRDDAWRKFYIFDVYCRQDNCFLHWDVYSPLLQEYEIDYIPLMKSVVNPTQEWLLKQLEANTFLIQDGCGSGEGIVIKRYNYVNRYGRVTWAKIVKNEFKEQNQKVFGSSTVEMYNLEYDIAQKFLTKAVVEKVKANIEPWSSRCIPQLLGTVWHDFVTEELWSVLKKYKNPTINFKALNRYVIARIKELMPEVF